MKTETELAVEKAYTLPQFTIISYKDCFIVVFIKLAKWIVLKNQIQLDIFDALARGAKIEQILMQFSTAQTDVIAVLTQIEAKKIENCSVKSIFSNEKLHLHITNRCNLRCPHCYMKSDLASENELTTEEIKNLCKQFYLYGGTHVSITGGEPLVREDFFDIVKYISDLGMKVSIFSNGCCWTEHQVALLKNLNIDGIQISLDVFDEATNSTVRGKNAFDRALKTIDLCVLNGIKTKIAVAAPYDILKTNQEKYVVFANKMLDRYGRDKIEFNFSYFFMPGRNLKKEDIDKFKDDYFHLVDSVVYKVYGDTSEATFIDNILDNHIYDSCGYGGLNVLANGDFYFCDRIPDVAKIGNIRDTNFAEIFRLMKIAESLGKIDNFMPCKICELRYICGCGCRAEYFRDFTKTSDIEHIDCSKIPPRICNKADKEKIYDLMIKTNERFFC